MQTPRRICFCNSAPFWGGGEHWHLTFASRLGLRGHETHILASRSSALASRAREAGVPCTEMDLGRLSFLQPFRMLELRSFFSSLRPEVVVLGLPQDVKAAGQAAAMAGVPLRLYRRGMGLPVRDSAFNRHLYRRVLHGVLVNAQDTRRALLSENPRLLPHKRIQLLENGVDEALLATPPAPVGDTHGPCVIGTAGRLVQQKGQAYLLQAAARLKQRGLDFELRIAGEGPLLPELKEMARSLGLEQHVRFLGFTQDMAGFYAGLHIFAFPSLWEGMGNALLEAMAAGLPVAGFAVSSMPEVVHEGCTGLLVPERDPEALALALEQLCKEPRTRAAMGAAGRRLASERFSLEKQVQRFEALLWQLLHTGHTSP